MAEFEDTIQTPDLGGVNWKHLAGRYVGITLVALLITV